MSICTVYYGFVGFDVSEKFLGAVWRCQKINPSLASEVTDLLDAKANINAADEDPVAKGPNHCILKHLIVPGFEDG